MERLDNHEHRIFQLETNYGELMTKVTSMEKGQMDIQNTVLKEFSSTKDMLNAQNAMNAKLMEHMYGIKTTKITGQKDIIVAAVSGLLGGTFFIGLITLVVTNWDKISKLFGG